MALLSKAILAILVLTATAVLLPKVTGVLLGLVFRGVGWLIWRRTRSRREYVIARARSEEEELRASRPKGSTTSPSRNGAEDEDWEKVDSSGASGVQTTTGSESSGGISEGNQRPEDWDGIIGFFHPFCNAGGGGERVLWEAIRATQKRWPKAICAIYTGDHEVNKAKMLERVENRFNIHLHAPTVVLLYLTTRKYVVSSSYPYMTLLGQSLGSLVVAYDAFTLLVPDVFIDTMGYAFTLALCKWLFPTVPVGAYVHYPTISTDMLASLDDKSGVQGINSGAGKGWKGKAKRRYWEIFAKLYGWVGRQIDVVMCNSSWTAGHIRKLWGTGKETSNSSGDGTASSPAVVFPPTAVTELESSIAVDEESEKTRQPVLLYIAQFRPEKNHPLVLRSFARFLQERTNNPAYEGQPSPRLVLIGSVRHSSPDETHIYNLRLLAHELRIRDQTTFLCDASWPVMLSHLRTASVGVNAMWNEHFGICVVEYQAAGLICVTHDSGGPREDIVVDLGDGATGFRAETEEQFAASFEAALALPEAEKLAMRQRARRSAQRFTEEEFSRKWLDQVQKLVKASKV
ncbi:Glycosyl transferase, family 1 [Penicillium expansum]|uniref:GDP-Man:Man(3)GlcNAc(2)-PP-Dol alpha-1,2-mannosyltransferase n=1 Tax=Penicillium expansum TaxID=27334 RepID=A0A0A2KU83_PENEN|nr:Glycosyl transferase, family 1 [Penicillium expansum]KGO44912.1 Glycosyl transferase, family 1 [Penicillium expansum]KGO54002.1 Glycosyl transferase, family 1 [Penicillium expansum]KGO71329.1 Glycosyl transferase, family 1 [Penicillium expansum]